VSALRTLVHRGHPECAAVPEAFVEVDACPFRLGVSPTHVSGEWACRVVTRDPIGP